jgi:hypothetical protein
MASARARLGRARRGMIKRKKQTGVVTGALSTLGTVAAFGAGQAKKADTAWKEYEAGYKELGGDVADIKKPGFFKRTAQQILPGGKTGLPEGDVTIGKKVYDRGQIRKAGSFLGSDAAAVLSDEQRQQYLGRTAPGRTEATTFTQGISSQPLMSTGGIGVQGQNYVTSDLASSRTGVYDQQGGIGFKGPDFLKGYKPDLKEVPDTEGIAIGSAPMDPGAPDYTKIQAGAAGVVEEQKRAREEWVASQEVDVEDYRRDYEKQQKTAWGDYMTNPPALSPEILGQVEKGRQAYSYARGGDFITNGPQKIIVGDNASGRERVTIKPLPSKNGEAKFGRYGDDAIKIIDGQPAHIDSSIEGDMSPEDIKKYGAGTINPVTGKKEYFLPALAAAFTIGSSLYKGYQATQNRGDVEAGRAAAGDIYQEQLGLLGDVRTQAVTGATQQAELGFDVTQSQLAAGGRESTMGARTAMRGVQEAGASAISQAGLATSGTIQQKSATQAGDISAKLKSDMTKLFETRQLAGRERDLTISTAKEKSDLAYRSGQMSAEEAYESTLTGLESIPTTFMEGLFG